MPGNEVGIGQIGNAFQMPCDKFGVHISYNVNSFPLVDDTNTKNSSLYVW